MRAMVCPSGVFFFAGSHNMLNVPSLTSFDVIARRPQQVIEAFSVPGRPPPWEFARFLGGRVAQPTLLAVTCGAGRCVVRRRRATLEQPVDARSRLFQRLTGGADKSVAGLDDRAIGTHGPRRKGPPRSATINRGMDGRVFDTCPFGQELHERELRFVVSRLTRHVVRPFARLVGKLIATCVEEETASSTECFCCEERASLGSCDALAPRSLPSFVG